MSGLAELCHSSGLQVTGSDLQEGPQVRRLISLGIPVFIGHKRSHIDKRADTLVYSSAVRQNNIELNEARRRGLSIIGRSEALAEMMRLKRGLVIAGTHGKNHHHSPARLRLSVLPSGPHRGGGRAPGRLSVHNLVGKRGVVYRGVRRK